MGRAKFETKRNMPGGLAAMRRKRGDLCLTTSTRGFEACLMKPCPNLPLRGEVFCMDHWRMIPVTQKRELLKVVNRVMSSRDKSAYKHEWADACMECFRALKAMESDCDLPSLDS